MDIGTAEKQSKTHQTIRATGKESTRRERGRETTTKITQNTGGTREQPRVHATQDFH